MNFLQTSVEGEENSSGCRRPPTWHGRLHLIETLVVRGNSKEVNIPLKVKDVKTQTYLKRGIFP